MKISFRRHHRETDNYPEQLAEWQIRHGADRHDMTPEQDRRLRQHNLMVNAGLAVERIEAVRWAVLHGRIGETDTSGAVDATRRRVWPETESGNGTDLCPLRFRREAPCRGRVEFRNFPPRYVCTVCGRIFAPTDVQRFATERVS